MSTLGRLITHLATARLQPRRERRLPLLDWAFTLFSAGRTLSYLPTLWAVQAGGDGGPNPLWTWCTWLGANATMAAWQYEVRGPRHNRALWVNLANAVMCGVALGLLAL